MYLTKNLSDGILNSTIIVFIYIFLKKSRIFVLILSAKIRLFLLKKAEEKGGKFHEEVF